MLAPAAGCTPNGEPFGLPEREVHRRIESVEDGSPVAPRVEFQVVGLQLHLIGRPPGRRPPPEMPAVEVPASRLEERRRKTQ